MRGREWGKDNEGVRKRESSLTLTSLLCVLFFCRICFQIAPRSTPCIIFSDEQALCLRIGDVPGTARSKNVCIFTHLHCASSPSPSFLFSHPCKRKTILWPSPSNICRNIHYSHCNTNPFRKDDEIGSIKWKLFGAEIVSFQTYAKQTHYERSARARIDLFCAFDRRFYKRLFDE